MLIQKPQAISGVSPNHETVVEEVYPSIAATSAGDFIHRLLDCIPTKVWGMKISNLLFGLLVAPLAATVYLWMKVFGSRYVLTNRVIKRVNSLGFRLLESATLPEITLASVDPDSRLSFYQTGDIRLTGAAGQTLMLLRGIPRPDRFCQVIQESVDAKRQVASALTQIKARH
ncbi:hypothetical protein [Schlesneria paludicola]|uniref:hypothetical protein n=1 Tax=Schlesneria paludicola TaxID=360056 RepID=UPI00029B2567|nr:hypothetical protein [Schlesneria paludicola]